MVTPHSFSMSWMSAWSMSWKVAANNEMTDLRLSFHSPKAQDNQWWNGWLTPDGEWKLRRKSVISLFAATFSYSVQSIQTKDAWRIWYIGWLQVTAVSFNRRLREWMRRLLTLVLIKQQCIRTELELTVVLRIYPLLGLVDFIKDGLFQQIQESNQDAKDK